MTVTYSGDGRIAAGGLYAGTGANGGVYADAETGSLPTLQIGTNFTGGATSLTEGTVSLTGGTTLTFEYQGAGTPPGGFGVGAVVGRADGAGSANGTLFVEGGSTIAFNNSAEEQMNGFLSGAYSNLTIGRGAGANGIVEVSGAGSSLTASGGSARINVGRDNGAGSFDISDGAVAGSFNLTAGRDGGRGIVSVSGAGSELRLGFDYGTYGSAYSGANGYSSLGRGFNGTAVGVVDSGGAIRIQNNDGVTDGAFLRLGRDEDSFGYLAVSGYGSALSLSQVGPVDQGSTGNIILVGQGGRGVLAVEHEAQVRVEGDGALIVVGSGRGGSDESLESQLVIRRGGDVIVDSTDSGSQTANGARVAVGAGNEHTGKLVVDGVGSTLTIRSDNVASNPTGATLTVGDLGDGRVEIVNGGQVLIDQGDDQSGGLFVSGFTTSDTSSGYVLISGAGSSLTLQASPTQSGHGSRIEIGNGENDLGVLAIRDGGSLVASSVAGTVDIGGVPNSEGHLIVDGVGSRFDVSAGATQLRLGLSAGYGTGRLDIGDGGKVYAESVSVNETGTLNLAGNFYGNVFLNGGTINVGGEDSIGAGFVSGSVDGFSGGDIRLEVFGTQSGQFDTLTVGDGGLGPGANITIDLSGLASAASGTRIKLIEVETVTGDTPPIDFNLIGPITAPASVIATTYVATGGQALYLDIGAPMNDTVGIVGTALSIAEGEASDNNEVTVTFRREGDLNVSMDVFVNLNFTGSADLTDLDTMGAVSTTVTFLAGQSEATLALGILGDDVFEGDETFGVSISGATKSDFSAVSVLNNVTTVTIVEDDLAPDLQISGLVNGGGGFNFRPIDPASSFLRLDTADAPVGYAAAFDLSMNDLEFNAGEMMLSRVVGRFIYDSYGNTTNSLHGVFSGSSTILNGGYQYRVTDALGVPNGGNGVYDAPTPLDGYARDINGDFSLGDALVEVPVGANYLFVAAGDSFFSDNVPDGNFGVALYTPLMVGGNGVGEAVATSQEFSDALAVVGYGGSGQGKLTLRDTNWALTSGAAIGVAGGDGRLLLSNGSDVTISDPGTYGTSTTPELLVGADGGSGYVNISGGSTVTADSSYVSDGMGGYYGGYGNVKIGESRGVGTLTVEGDGSRLIASGVAARIRVGNDYGDGLLQVRDGGYVATLNLQVGRNSGTGILNVTGEGSTVRVSAERGTYTSAYASYAGSARFGRDGSDGSFRVSDGGRIVVENIDGLTDGPFFEMGRDAGTNGSGEIIGDGSIVQIIQHGADDTTGNGEGSGLRIGRGGVGELRLTQGGRLEVLGDGADIFVAEGRGGMGSTEQSRLEVLSGSYVMIDAGGYRDGLLSVAAGQGTNGEVVVDGAGSVLRVETSYVGAGDYNSAEIQIAGEGNGRLTIRNDGAVYARELTLGTVAGATAGRGYVTVSGGGDLYLTTPDDPRFTADPNTGPSGYRGLRIAEREGSYGRVDVTGEGSTLTVQGGAGMIRVGRNAEAEGRLTVSGGAEANGFFVDVGRQGAKGYIDVDGVGSKLTVSNAFGSFGYGDQGEAGFLRLGRDGGYGSLEITNGGEVQVRNQFGTINDLPIVNVGRGYGGEGYLLVSGSGIPPGDDQAQASSLNIFQDGPANDGFRVGEYNGPLLQIGRSGGEGTVIAEYGAEINVSGENARIWVGQSSDGNGPAPRSTLEVRTGASVTVSSEGYQVGSRVSVGTESTGFGRLTVDGGSLTIRSNNLDNYTPMGGPEFGAQLRVGDDGEGDLVVRNGGRIDIIGNDDSYPGFGVGLGDNSTGTALITGAGSEILIGAPYSPFPMPGSGPDMTFPFSGGIIDVANGVNATGTLIIQDGASVSNTGANSITQIGENTGSTGLVVVQGAGSSLYAGTNLQIGLDFDFAAAGATLDLGGDGTLRIDDDGVVTVGNSVEIGTNGKLDLDGTLTINDAAGVLENEGIIYVGGDNAIGAGDGNFSLDTGTSGLLEFEFRGFGAGEFDTLELDVNIGTTNFDGNDIVLDMSGLGVVNVGDSATILTFDSGVFPGLADIGTGLVNAQIVNAPPGVGFEVTQDGTSGDVIVTVTDAPSGSVSVEGFAQILEEGQPGDATVFAFVLNRNGDLDETVDVNWSIAGTGANPVDAADFEGGVLPSGTAVFGVGESTTTVVAEVAEDILVEADEGFTFSISNATSASGSVVVLNDTTTAIMLNDDSPDTISIQSFTSGLEDDFGLGNSLFFDVTRTGDLSGDVTVDFVLDANGATSGPDLNIDLLANSDDFVGGAPQIGQVTILDGQDTARIEIEIAEDIEIEPREDFTITLTGFSGPQGAYEIGNAVGTGTIISDDGLPPVIPVGLEADVFGDPHLVSLDGLGYDFQAVGEFTLVEATAGAALNVQIRTAPVEGSDLVSIISGMAADMGQGVSLMLDVNRSPALLIDGVATDVPATGVTPVAAGDGNVYFDGEAYTIVFGTGDALKVAVFDDFMNVCVFLDPANAGGRSLHGLLGNADGDLSNDYQLRDGSPIPVDQISFDNGVPSLEFDFLYGAYADSWRITDGTSLFHYAGTSGDEGTADYTDTNFPVGVLTTDVLPADVLADAIAAADAAGITDPVLRESAILDFALTGDDEFAAGAAGVAADPEVNSAPTSAPDLPTTVGVTPVVTSIVEGDDGSLQTVFFTVYRIGDTDQALTVDWSIGGDIDQFDLEPLEATTGQVTFAQGESTQTFSVDVLAERSNEDDEDIVATITAPDGILVGAPSAITTIITDDFAAIGADDVQTARNEAGVTIQVADLLANDRDPDGDPLSISGVSMMTDLGGTVSYTFGDSAITLDLSSITVNPGETVKDLFSYTVTDFFGDEDTVLVSLTVGTDVGLAIAGDDTDGTFNGSLLGDFINAGGGNDVVLSGDGNDEADGGTGDDGVAGQDGDDMVFGGFGNDFVDGGDGNDTLFGGNDDDILIGGSGEDDYFGGAGFDTVLFQRSTTGLKIDLTGNTPNAGDAAGETFDSIERILGSETASNTLTGGNEDNRFEGGAADDTLEGGGGNDRLRGNGGTDTMDGGEGDDIFYLDSIDDVVIEAAGQGYDRAISSASLTLAANVEAGNLTGSADENLTGNDLNNWLNGNSGDNVISGLDGNDRLDGNAGNDTLFGGQGSDLLEGGSGEDLFVAELNGGFDTVLDFTDGEDRISLLEVNQTFGDLEIEDTAGGALISHFGGQMLLRGVASTALDAGDFVEGAGAPPLTPVVTGTENADNLSVREGPVILQGLAGNDLVRVFEGAATLEGGADNDRYYVYEAGTVITELEGEGIDSVYTRVDLTLSDNVENAATNSNDQIDLTGNALANALTGNVASNTLTGEAGDDRLVGKAGADVLNGGLDNDFLLGGADADTFVFDITNHGIDRIGDFEVGIDKLDFSGTGLAFTDFEITGETLAMAVSSAGTILFNGVSADDLTEADFIFS